MLIIGILLALVGISIALSSVSIKKLSDTISNTLWITGLLIFVLNAGCIVYAI